MKFWLKIVGALLVVWAIAGLCIHFARAAKPTPQSVGAFLQTDKLQNDPDRARRIAKAADMLNRLDFDERQELRQNRVTEQFFRALTPDEQGKFLDATLPAGFKQMMESFNKMDREKRKRLVDRAVQEIQKREAAGETTPPRLDGANEKKIVDQGLRSFYSEASAEVKLDVAPLIEEMQRSLQGAR